VGDGVAVGVASCASIGRTVPMTKIKTNISKLTIILFFIDFLQ
jgi:hypothetical protein